MSNPPGTRPNGSNRMPVLGLAIACYLIAIFLYRAFTTAHEYLMRPEQVLEMVLDAGMVIGLFGFKAKIPATLFWIALAAGIGLWGIRLLGGDASWWTGHLMYALPPR